MPEVAPAPPRPSVMPGSAAGRPPAPGGRAASGGYVEANPDRAAHAKLEQLKDLYLTAEAIGEDALVRHFDEVSQRQRDLIRDYFRQPGLRPSVGLRPADENPVPGGPGHQDGSATRSS